MEEDKNIELRSEEVQEILGQPPHWIIRAGISIIAVFVMVGLILSFVFKYPDIIQSRITITTENPPSSLKAQSTGKITNIFVCEKQEVKSGQVIAIIENTANYEDIIYLSQILDTLKNISSFSDSVNLHLNLGECQSYYSLYLKQIKAYKTFKQLKPFIQKIETAQKEIQDQQLYTKQLQAQKKLAEKDLNITKNQQERDFDLFQKGIIPKLEYEKTERTFLQQNLALERTNTELITVQMQINKLEQLMLDLSIQEKDAESNLQSSLEEAYSNLKSQLNAWKQKYMLISPIDGTVTFTRIWGVNQNIQAGEIAATIIPTNITNIIGKVEIPSEGAGKVKVGQTVNIKLDNFPYMEYGMMKGTVKSISLVAISNQDRTVHIAEVTIPNTFISNYGEKIKFTQEMTGTAEIITEDLRLIQRLLYPLKSIWKKNIE